MRSFFLAGVLGAMVIAGCDRSTVPSAGAATTIPSADGALSRTPEEWKKVLPAETYHVMFEAGTERPFNNAYHDNHADGIYVSAATDVPLFSSKDKYESGTGWPSFTKPISPAAVILRPDPDGSGRGEVLDASSNGHLGHLFNDGPAPLGTRYCMNSAALKFVPAK